VILGTSSSHQAVVPVASPQDPNGIGTAPLGCGGTVPNGSGSSRLPRRLLSRLMTRKRLHLLSRLYRPVFRLRRSFQVPHRRSHQSLRQGIVAVA
jgi:hypothetical protein